MICIVEDNGIGRAAANELKDVNTVEYQSKGMTLIQERVQAINSTSKEKIKIFIDDISNDGEATGTKVTLFLPLDVMS